MARAEDRRALERMVAALTEERDALRARVAKLESEALAREEGLGVQADHYRAEAARLRARVEELAAERDMLRRETASISAEFGLPPTVRPAEGEIARLLSSVKSLAKERDSLRAEVAEWADRYDMALVGALDAERYEAIAKVAVEERNSLRARVVELEAAVTCASDHGIAHADLIAEQRDAARRHAARCQCAARLKEGLDLPCAMCEGAPPTTEERRRFQERFARYLKGELSYNDLHAPPTSGDAGGGE